MAKLHYNGLPILPEDARLLERHRDDGRTRSCGAFGQRIVSVCSTYSTSRDGCTAPSHRGYCPSINAAAPATRLRRRRGGVVVKLQRSEIGSALRCGNEQKHIESADSQSRPPCVRSYARHGRGSALPYSSPSAGKRQGRSLSDIIAARCESVADDLRARPAARDLAATTSQSAPL